ncbi:SGT1-domain-containing protein [Acrodontium crateriforme]|uniref:SGT1-domain-containing protein n=1 Tax=Acrodontium crateriforme TaxID=150365 RepID=A0AAQ3LX12_9PEZI|nr:SGT1-domain-containing protein [Acrodontium crateriforme]
MADSHFSQPDDGLKWFGEGFDGFPKRLPDDCVEYVIYAIDETIAGIAATRTRLNEIRKTALSLEKEFLKDYIWQRDGFQLKLFPDITASDSSQCSTPCLKGRTNFGDSAADEWLIVYLLLELSKKCPDAWIRVYDTDGEFLLIEAAKALPKWLNPDVAENRVWISNGHLRIIPLDDESTTRNLSLQAALDFNRTSPEKAMISPFIEDEAFYRLREYPAAIASSFHHSLTTIPRSLAYVLHQNPAYISPAVEAFYLRDPIALKPLATKDLSTLQFPPEDFVTVSIKYTKVGFAQLRSQQFEHPPSWTGILPRLSDSKVEMGMKLTCGFEMLLADKQNRDKRSVREMKLLLEDLQSGDETLPNDETIETWPQTQDDEKWLDIDYNDFENELSGSKGEKKGSKGTGFGDQGAQENLQKMVSRFEDFLNDDDAGADGVDDDDIDDEDEDEEGSDTSETKDHAFDEAEFEKAMKEMMGMPADEIEKSGLLDEARRLALEDAEDGSDMDEDEEMRKVMELMEKELKGHGALDLNGGGREASKTLSTKKKVQFGPEPPPGFRNSKGKEKAMEEDDDDFVGPGDGELSSDDDEFNDVDLGLAKNMLESFKGQAGMAGPAGNLMRAMGVNMPRDEGSDDEK